MIRVLALACSVGLLGCASAGPSVREEREGLPFIEDDYPKALAEAKSRNLPLFVDAWATWCHSCVFMKEHVMNRPELAHNGSRYVFLSLDTEKEKSAAFLEKFPIEMWPTLLIIDPQSETPALKWLGTLTVEQFEKLLDDGELAVKAGAGDDATAQLARADRLYAEGKFDEAIAGYRSSLAKMDSSNPQQHARAVESLLNALYSGKQFEACAQVAASETPGLPKGPSFLNAIVLGLGCADNAGEAPWRAKAVAALEPLGQQALSLDGVLADDKSGLYESLVGLREEAKDEAGKKALALQWLAFLEGEAGRAKTPAARAVFDPHRLNAAMAAGEPLRVEAALKQSEKDLPDDYNPPARLAVAYREAGRYDEALAAADRAMSRVYGPRKLRVFETRASILQKKGDVAGRKQVLTQALTYAKGLPVPQQPSPKWVARIEAELAK